MFIRKDIFNFTFWSKTCSLRKWYLIGMCLAFKCITRFLDILMPLVLSQKIDIVCEKLTWISCRIWIIQRSCVQQVAIAMYHASIVDNAIELCFLLNQETKHCPKRNAPPLTLFRLLMLPTKFASIYAWSVKYFFFGYHNSKSRVPCRYLNILFTALRWVSIGFAWKHLTMPTACMISGLVPVR